MNKIVLVFASLVIIFSSCGKSKNNALSESAIHAKVDSLIGVKIQELNQQSMEDLDHRISIEVKAKADSIVDARTGKIDTTKPKPQLKQPQPPIKPQGIFRRK